MKEDPLLYIYGYQLGFKKGTFCGLLMGFGIGLMLMGFLF